MKTLGMVVVVAAVAVAAVMFVLSNQACFAVDGERLLAKKQIETVPGRAVEMVVKSERNKASLVDIKNYLGNNPPAIIVLPRRDDFKDGNMVGMPLVNRYVKDPIKGTTPPKDLLKDAKRPAQEIIKDISLDKDYKKPEKIDDGLIGGKKPPYDIIRTPKFDFGDGKVDKFPGTIDVKDPIRSITPPADLINGPKNPNPYGSSLKATFEVTETPNIIKDPSVPAETARPDPRAGRQRIPGIRGGGSTIHGITEVITKRIGDEESILQ